MFETPHSTWTPQWTPTEHEVFRDFGYAAFTAQMLESSVIAILLAGEEAGKIEIKKPKKKKNLETELYLSEQTLGSLIRELRQGGIDKQLTDIVEDALAARNYLMHHFFVWNAQNYQSDEGRGKMLKELQDLRFRIGRAEIVFKQVWEQIFEELYGITAERGKELYRQFKTEQQAGEQAAT
jgi:hypothetical protein